jgi:hypothetical protein
MGRRFDAQPTFDWFPQIGPNLLNPFALCYAARQRGHFRPEPAFFGIMDDCFECHAASLSTERLLVEPMFPPEGGRAMLVSKTVLKETLQLSDLHRMCG